MKRLAVKSESTFNLFEFEQACGAGERGSLSVSGLERSLVVSGVAVPTKAA